MNWLKQLFSAEPGISFGRVASVPFILAVIIWISYFLWTTAHSEAGIRFPDIGIIAALNALALSFYTVGKGIGKTADILTNRKPENGNTEVTK